MSLLENVHHNSSRPTFTGSSKIVDTSVAALKRQLARPIPVSKDANPAISAPEKSQKQMKLEAATARQIAVNKCPLNGPNFMRFLKHRRVGD